MRIGAAAAAGTPTLAQAAEGLNLVPDWRLLGTNLAVFAALVYPVNKLLIAPLVGILREREARTAGSAEQADELGRQAGEERARLEEHMDRARAEAAARRAEILAEARVDEQHVLDAAREAASQEVAQVRESVQAELDQARDSLRADARGLADEAAARILGRPL